MAKKTWIKVKRGILEPKHRRQLGEAWYLYFYMLDLTNWADGVIYEWKDKDIACELEIPLATLRDHRRKLEDNLYIKTTIKRYGLQIAITNWTNPREYSGELYNEIKGDGESAPSLIQGDTQSDTEVNTESDTQSSGGSAPLHLTHRITLSQNTDHIINSTPHQLLIQEILKIIPYQFKNNDQPNLLDDLVKDYGMERVLSVATWCATKRPKSMGHAISMITTAIKGWQEEQKKNDNDKVLEEWLNGNKRTDN